VNCELIESPACDQAPLARPQFAQWSTPEGELVATFHREPDGYAVRFVDRADFVISLAGAKVTCKPVPGVSAATVRDLYLNQVVPMIRGQAGELVIHASAAAVNGGALAFVASSGQGKSTLAAGFARAGWPFLSDDGIYLTREGAGYLANPNRASFRLRQDSEAFLAGQPIPDENEDDKSRVEAGSNLPFQSEPLPLRALYFLGPDVSPAPRLAPLSRQRALAELINHSFLLDVADRCRLKRHFDTLGELVESVPSYTLDYPRNYDLLPEVIAMVVEHVSGGRIREVERQDPAVR
jgi:hypothetical protein